jgi:hypothetical protein
MLWQNEIRRAYFFGDVDNEEAANFINDLTSDFGDSEPEKAFEIINLTT